MYIIKVTEENKKNFSPTLGVGENKEFHLLPKSWGNKTPYNYEYEGFVKVDKPTITNIQKLGSIIEIEGVYQYEIIDLTPVEIHDEELSNSQTVSAIQFISQLSFEGIAEAAIIEVIDTLPEPNKTMAKVSYNRAATFDRNNSFMLLVSQAFGKTELEMDEIFIKAKKL